MANASSETINLNGISLTHINMFNVTKLTSSNYIMWSRQVHALIHGYGLSHYLDATRSAPDQQITVNSVVSPNPEYEAWNRQDQLIYSALIGTMSVNVQPTVSRATTSAAVWATLAATYAKPSRGHIKQLQHQVKQWKKENRTIDEYVQGFINRFDQLALIGKIIDHEDQVDYILEGLPDEYKSVVDQMQGRDVAPSLSEIHEKLLNHEARLITSSAPATYLCSNPVFHSRMKHIALDYHFVRNQIQAGHLRVRHISTKDQLADALTKPLPRSTFQLLTNKIGVSKTPPS